MSRGLDYPLPTETERVSATRNNHISTQTGLRREPDYRTSTPIEACRSRRRLKIGKAVHPFSTEKSPQRSRFSQAPPASMGGLHLKIQKLKHRDNAEQTLAESKVKSSRPYSSQNVPRSFRSTRGRVAGQHAHGFLMGSRLVEIEQNALYNKGTQKEKTGKRRSRRTRKRRCALYAGQHLNNHDAR